MNGEDEFRERIEVGLQKLLQEMAFIKADITSLNEKRERDNDEMRHLIMELQDEYRNIIMQLRADITIGMSNLSGRVNRVTNATHDVKKKPTRLPKNINV